MIKPFIDEKNHKFSLHNDDSIPDLLVGDENRLAQVIHNLLANAVKFTPDNGEIQLKTSLLDKENRHCEIKIEIIDNGIGVSRDQQAAIFNIFEQGDGSFSRKFGGIGLGLPISKHIVEMMGGELSLESEQDKGSNFSFVFRASAE
jgi:signal transduction histidine kinase